MRYFPKGFGGERRDPEEVKPPLLDEGALDIILSEDVPVLFADISALHAILHVGLPVGIRW